MEFHPEAPAEPMTPLVGLDAIAALGTLYRARHGRKLLSPFDPELETSRQIAAALNWPFVDLESYKISCGILRRLPAELACRWRCVPMIYNTHRVVLVVDDPFQGYYLAAHPEQLGSPYDHRVEIALGTRKGIDAALTRRLTVVEG